MRPILHLPRLKTDPEDQKEMAAWTLMDIVQVVGVILQLMMVGPDMQRIGAWYRGAWEIACALFQRNRESNASIAYVACAGC